MFDFRRITLFCLEKRLSKHKMTMFSKIFFEEHGPFAPLAMPMPKATTTMTFSSVPIASIAHSNFLHNF